MDAHWLRIDDFDTHEEEGRLQDQPNDEQQQQLLKDENKDEYKDSNNDEGEGEAEQDEVGVDNTNLWSIYDQQRFERACKHIHENDSDLVQYSCESPLDDCRAVLLGSALLGNTELKDLDITFTYQERLRSQGKSFTSRGAQAITGGIFGSKIKRLFLRGEDEEELPFEMSHICARSIEDLCMYFRVKDEFAVQLSESLTVCKLLRHFTLQLNNEMTPRGAQALSNFLRSSPISTLEFTDVTLDDAATMATMQTIYLEGVQPSKNIQNLLLYGIVGDMHALTTILPKLQELSIRFVELNLSDVELLTRGLRDAHQIHKLSLGDCELDCKHMSVLSPILGNHPSIKNVTLDSNFFEDKGIAIFVDHWRPESIIEELVLCDNDIGPKGALHLMNASANHPTLHSLDLRWNRTIGFDGLKLIGEALSNAKLHTLDLVGVLNWIEYDDDASEAAVIQEAKRMAAGKALLEGVRANGHLLEMRLEVRRDESHLPMNVVEEIDLYVNANALGRGAVLEHQNTLPSGVWSHFLAKERISSSLLFLFLQELPGVVMGGNCNSNIGRKRRRA